VERVLASFSGNSRFTLYWKIRAGIWFAVQHILFKASFFPSRIRPMLLRLFGASIGRGVVIRRGVRVHFPWNLVIGDDCWIGEEVWLINHERITIESNVCISQRSIICSGGHDFRSATLEYAHNPILIKGGSWLCVDVKILPGVTIGKCSVVSAGQVARKSVPDYSILVDGVLFPIDPPS
jgi:putative colanic acid biosynthesis acetyltransferase WcaF